MAFVNDFYSFLNSGVVILLLIAYFLLHLVLVLWKQGYVDYMKDGRELPDDHVKEYNVIKRVVLINRVFALGVIIGYFVLNPDLSEDANLKIGEYKDVYEVSERFNVVMNDYMVMRNALDDQKFSKYEYNTIVDLGELIGEDYKDEIRDIELGSEKDPTRIYDRMLLEVEKYIKEDNIRVLREFALNEDVMVDLHIKDSYMTSDEKRLHTRVLKHLTGINIGEIEEFIEENPDFESDKLAEVMEEYEDLIIMPYGDYYEDVLDVVTGRIVKYLEDNDESSMFEMLVLKENTGKMLVAWDDQSISDVEYAMFEHYDQVRGTKYTEVIDRLVENPESISVYNEFEEMKTGITFVL